MKRIVQVLGTSRSADAISICALLIRDRLRKRFDSEIVAEVVYEDIRDEVSPLDDLEPLNSDDVLIYHASSGEPKIAKFLEQTPAKVVVLYHNITPSKYVTEWEPSEAEKLDIGRREVKHLSSVADLAIGVSSFNCEELTEMGYKNVAMSPLVCEPRRLTAARITDPFRSEVSTRFVALSRVYPHKRHDLLIQAFYAYCTHVSEDCHLYIVGHPSFENYQRQLRGLVDALGLNLYVSFTGAVSESKLAALLSGSTAMVSMSEHEGVGVPLLEAMAMGVPTMARDFAAVKETVGEASLVVPGDFGPVELSESMRRLVDDKELRSELVNRGLQRVNDFEPERTLDEFEKVLQPLL